MIQKQKTLLILGVGPVPIGNPERIYAPGLRIMNFAKCALKQGYKIIIGEAMFGGDADETSKTQDSNAAELAQALDSNAQIRRLPLEPFKAADIISEWARQETPAAIVSTTDVMNLASALINTDIPKWMDFNGHPMVERQEISYICSCDNGLIDQWLYIIPSLINGDYFSTCSEAQRYALIGELGAAGRLNQFTAGYNFVANLPPSYHESDHKPDGRKAFRGSHIPDDAFVVLLTGGFNTWVDEETLFTGLSSAMKKSDKIHVAVTGGEIKGHNVKTFTNFKEKVEQSEFKNRFHFFGWAPFKDLPNYYAESDIAVNIDRYTYEGILGARNRIFAWMNFSLPVLTTPLSELPSLLVKKNLAKGFKIGNPDSLADAILDAQKNYPAYKEMAARAKKFLDDEWTRDILLKPLFDWLASPKAAPDKSGNKLIIVAQGKYKGLRFPDNPLSRHLFETLAHTNINEIKEKLIAAEHELACIKGSRIYKLLTKIKSIIR